MEQYVIVAYDNPGEDLLWSNIDGFVSLDSEAVTRFTEMEKQSLRLPVGGKLVTPEEIDRWHNMRLGLEGLPIPISTANMSPRDFHQLENSIALLGEEVFGRPLDLTNDEDDSFWWSELEEQALDKHGAKYYSDIP